MSKIQAAVAARSARVVLRSKGLSGADCAELQALLENNKDVQHLDLSNNDIDAAGAELLSFGLQLNNTLVSLNLSGNKMGSKGGMSIASALQINTSLQSLDIGDTDQDISSVIAFTTVLASNTSLRALNLDRPLLKSAQAEAAGHLSRMLSLNTTLQSLSLRKFDFTDEPMVTLLEGLLRNTGLQSLDLSCNKISRDGAGSLSHALSRSPSPSSPPSSLSHLSLDSNSIDDAGAALIASGLAKSTLKFLGISHNKIKGAGMDALAKAFQSTPSITGFRVWGNPAISGPHLNTDVCARLGAVLKARSDVTAVDIRAYEVDGKILIAYGS